MLKILKAACLVVMAALPIAASAGQDRYRIEPGVKDTIFEHGVCRRVKNLSGTPMNIPTKYASEWSVGGTAFLGAQRDNTEVTPCLEPPNRMNMNYYLTASSDGYLTAVMFEDDVNSNTFNVYAVHPNGSIVRHYGTYTRYTAFGEDRTILELDNPIEYGKNIDVVIDFQYPNGETSAIYMMQPGTASNMNTIEDSALQRFNIDYFNLWFVFVDRSIESTYTIARSDIPKMTSNNGTIVVNPGIFVNVRGDTFSFPMGTVVSKTRDYFDSSKPTRYRFVTKMTYSDTPQPVNLYGQDVYNDFVPPTEPDLKLVLVGSGADKGKTEGVRWFGKNNSKDIKYYYIDSGGATRSVSFTKKNRSNGYYAKFNTPVDKEFPIYVKLGYKDNNESGIILIGKKNGSTWVMPDSFAQSHYRPVDRIINEAGNNQSVRLYQRHLKALSENNYLLRLDGDGANGNGFKLPAYTTTSTSVSDHGSNYRKILVGGKQVPMLIENLNQINN